jgi:hypothetical protein
MSKGKKGTKKKTESKINIRMDGDIDRRTLPVADRPKPTSGQSRKEFVLEQEKMSPGEAKVTKALNGTGAGVREVLSVEQLGKATRLTLLQVRNSLRRLVPSGWAERVEEILTDEGETKPVRGHYRLAEGARRRLA